MNGELEGITCLYSLFSEYPSENQFSNKYKNPNKHDNNNGSNKSF